MTGPEASEIIPNNTNEQVKRVGDNYQERTSSQWETTETMRDRLGLGARLRYWLSENIAAGVGATVIAAEEETSAVVNRYNQLETLAGEAVGEQHQVSDSRHGEDNLAWRAVPGVSLTGMLPLSEGISLGLDAGLGYDILNEAPAYQLTFGLTFNLNK